MRITDQSKLACGAELDTKVALALGWQLSEKSHSWADEDGNPTHFWQYPPLPPWANCSLNFFQPSLCRHDAWMLMDKMIEAGFNISLSFCNGEWTAEVRENKELLVKCIADTDCLAICGLYLKFTEGAENC